MSAHSENQNCAIGYARTHDAQTIHALGCAIPELRVDATGEFMTIGETHAAIEDPSGSFLVAISDGRVVGFGYVRIDDSDGIVGSACIVYVAVAQDFRRRGVGALLVRSLASEASLRGAEKIYAWADPGSGVVEMLERGKFRRGKACVYMSAEVSDAR